MTVNEFIQKLESLSKSLKEKPIKIIAPNGLRLKPNIKMYFENEMQFWSESDDITSVIITYKD